MKQLSPSLPILQESLFGPSDELIFRLAFEPDTVAESLRNSILRVPHYAAMVEALSNPQPILDIEVTEHVMPEWLQDEIRRTCESATATFDETPQPGQIRLITEVIGPEGSTGLDLSHPLSVCLNYPYPDMPDEIWHGWLVTPETDYANYWDVLIEDTDGPCDPQAGMVQITTPVYIYLPSTNRVIGQLSPERVAALRSVSAEMLSGTKPDISPHPGYPFVRKTLNGHSVLTGTPLGGKDDPRWKYQSLYADILVALNEPVELAMDAARERVAVTAPSTVSQIKAWFKKLNEQLLEQAMPWQPGSDLQYAMGSDEADADKVEGKLGDVVHIQAEAGEEGMLSIVLRRCCSDPLTVTVLCEGQIHEQYHLDEQTSPRCRIELDMERQYRLNLALESGQSIANLDFFVS